MSTPVTTSYNAWRRVSKTERVAVRERGRICEHAGCETILSIYNPSKYCGAHVTDSIGRRRRGAAQAALIVPCKHCGDEFETRNAHRKFCSDRCRMAAFARRKRAAERAIRQIQQQAQEPAGPLAGLLVEDAA